MDHLLRKYSNDEIEAVKRHLRKRVDAPARTAGLGVVFDLTYWCNLSCKGCGVFAKHVSNKTLDPDLLETKYDGIVTILNKVKDYLVENHTETFFINFGGGEPFLRSDIFDILLKSNELFGRDHIGIDSNGTLLNNQIFINEVSSLISYLGISIDGLEGYHNWWRGVDGAFQKSIRTIKKVISTEEGREILEVSSVATKSNINMLPELIRFLHNLGVEKYSIHRSMPVGRLSHHSDLVPSSEEYFDMLVNVVRVAEELDMKVHFHHTIESIYATLLLGATTYAGRKIGEPDKRSSIGIDPSGCVYFDPWCMVTPWNQLSGGSLLDDTTLQNIFDTEILMIATEYSSPDARCSACQEPCSGGSRIAAASSALAEERNPSLTRVLGSLTATDTACPKFS